MRAGWGLLLTLLLVGTALLAGRPQPAGPRAAVTLPDGSELQLARVTAGANHSFRYGQRPQDWFYPLLPERLRRRLNCQVLTHRTRRSDALMVWLRHRGGPTAGGTPGTAAGGRLPFYLAVFDEQGCEAPLLPGATRTRTRRSGEELSGWELPAYPRRSPTLGLRVYAPAAAGAYGVAGQMTFANPLPDSRPVAPAERLPATRQTNELQVTLLRLETGLWPKQAGLEMTGRRGRLCTRATFAFREGGTRTEGWEVQRLAVEDSAGEPFRTGCWRAGWEAGLHTVALEGALWAGEPAWRLRVEVARSADFPATDLWQVHNVPLPRPGEWRICHAETNRHGARLEFLGVSAPGARLPGELQSLPPHPTLHLRTPYPLEELRVGLVEVRTPSGRKLPALACSSSTGPGGRGAAWKETVWNYAFALDPAEEAEAIHVTFAVTPVRTVEFLARPTLPAAGTPAPGPAGGGQP